MGFGVRITSKVKRLFCSWPAKEQTANEANLFDESDHQGRMANSGLGFGAKDFGSKNDMFFDSQAWLDSDCDDDFCSVNGEFTPSRGNTPNHQIGIPKTPPRNSKSVYDELFLETESKPSPTDSKKKLSELLQDWSEQAGIQPRTKESKVEDVENPDIGMNEKPYIRTVETNHSQNSSEWNPKPNKERKTTACCIPSLLPSISSMKPKTSPAR
ncbi:Uncharacterized protein AXF42_Ash015109 [Apostasia shenzhenica]|uniref:Uncharacterized protein n=1 Tax=Apostasia shenzhenica TaxID=1088818 RepID=A0A2I0AQC0_9ASPA|nr:Uncharacterized protein AXF42_Ash015109 [Apostasia shenzhenica]